MQTHVGYGGYPTDFFSRSDETDDALFYAPIRMVQHIDDAAIDAVGTLYDDLAVTGRVLDLMGSWVSHFRQAPKHLTVLGMNWTELHANPIASEVIAHDLNREPVLPFSDNSFDDIVCAVSVDYLTRPFEVFDEASRVLRSGGRFVCTFSNRCFPTKAIRGWLAASDQQRCKIVASYFRLSNGWAEPTIDVRIGPGGPGDPLYAVWATSDVSAAQRTNS